MEYLWTTYGLPMDYLWTTYGLPMEQHRRNTGPTPSQYRASSLCPGHSKAGRDGRVLRVAIWIDVKAGEGLVAGPALVLRGRNVRRRDACPTIRRFKALRGGGRSLHSRTRMKTRSAWLFLAGVM